MNGSTFCLVLVLVVSVEVAVTALTSTDHEYRLVRDLLKRYDKKVRPSININETVNVTFGVALAQIIDVDEKNQIMTTNCWINQGWIDPKLKWEREKYGNISVIRIPYNDIWLPDIVLYNSATITGESVSTNAIVTHDGNVTWLSMVIFKSSCAINVKYFPYDEQNCTMSFASWTFDAKQLDLINVGEEGDVSNYMNSTEWELIKFIQIREPVFFSCCPDPYVFMYHHILIRRRPLFYLFNMVMPCILITLVALLGFYMPSDSGEKISMGITTLLSMTVFLMIVTDKMPPTSDVLPLIGLYYGITIFIVSFATAMTVLTLNIHHKGSRGHEIPETVKKIFFGFIAKILFIHLDVEDSNPSLPQTPDPQPYVYAKVHMDKFPENGGLSPRFARHQAAANHLQGSPNTQPMGAGLGGGVGEHFGDTGERQFMRVLQKVYQTIEKNEIRLADQDRKDNIRQEWQQLALILDRLLLLAFVILTITMTLALLWPPETIFPNLNKKP